MMKKTDEQKPARILVVDDDKEIRQLVHTLLKRAGYQSDTVEDASAARKQLVNEDYDVVISDIMMPGMSGIELLKILHADAPDVPVILMTGNPNMETAAEALRAGSAVDYLSKPFSTDQLLRTVERAVEIKRVRDENQRLTAENERYQLHLEEMVEEKSSELVKAYDFTLEAMLAMLDAREKATGQHSIRVRDLSLILGRALGLSPSDLGNLARGTLLHDIGKIATPDTILLKPGKLTADEWAIMKTHAQAGYDIVQSSEHLTPAAELILSHHEKFDGSGYPRGLKGKEICLGARIFSVIDAYDAMRSARIYKNPIPAEEAVDEIIRCCGSHFDPEVVQVFLTCQPTLEKAGAWDIIDKQP